MERMVINPETLVTILRQATPKTRFCLAYSGGVDSHVLLHLLARVQQQHPEYQVRAIYINHGLNKKAALWQTHAAAVCAALTVPFQANKVQITKKAGESVEALARTARYQCFSEQLLPEECLLTAHNADDQVETVLLQLLRGAGVAGLAAMPEKKIFAGSVLLRPLLNFTRAEIAAYAKAHQLQWVEDESNSDIRFDRNYLRHQVVPLIKKRWPNVVTTLSRSAEHCAQAKRLMFDVAMSDLTPVLADFGSIDILKLLDLPLSRQQQVLRYWIHQQGFLLPSTRQLQEIFKNVIASRYDATPCVQWGSQQVRRYRHQLYLTKELHKQVTVPPIAWDFSSELRLPNNMGVLCAVKTSGKGICVSQTDKNYFICFRQGGESFQPAGRKGHHRLKHLFQEWGIPPWLRHRIPLLYQEKQLIAVIGYAVAQGFFAEGGLLISLVYR